MTTWTKEQEDRWLEMAGDIMLTGNQWIEFKPLDLDRNAFIAENLDAPQIKAQRDIAVRLLRDALIVMNAHAVGFKTQEVIEEFINGL